MGLSKNIAYRLRTLREAANLSQQEVADRADLSLSLVAKLEQGRKADPRASTLLALASALGVRPGQLLEELTAPPEGMFPPKGKKGKKGRKKQEKLLAKLVATVGVGVGAGTNGGAADHAEESNGIAVVADALGIEADDKKVPKKKKKPHLIVRTAKPRAATSQVDVAARGVAILLQAVTSQSTPI